MSVALIVSATASFALPPCPASGFFHNCFGTYTYANGDKYVGEWKFNKWNGQGTYTYANGDKYVGEYKDEKRNGQGTITFPDGGKYVGEWKDNKWNGQGTFTFLGDNKLVGEWKDGNLRYGQGTVTFPDGGKYVGEWKDQTFNGQGTYTFPDGTIEEGIWKNGKLQLIFTQIKESYDAKEFSKAFTDAQTLAVEGNADAQFLLGKMYADGRGTIQVTTAAHMWFNIASMGGNDEAYEQRKAVTAEMTPGAVEKAQAMAMTCIQSVYKDCGLVVKPSAKKAEPTLKAVTDLSSLKSHFKDQSPLKRKQIQYALKKLGVYSSSVDGSWGNRTAAAVSSYQKIQELQSATPSELYESVLSKVDVPSSFASAKKVVSKQRSSPKTNKRKPTEVVEKSPQGYTRAQAEAICEPLAEIAGANAIRAYKAENTSIRCQAIGSFTSCNRVSSGGGFGAGFAEAYLEDSAKKKAEKAVMRSCLAKYGWY